MNDGTDDNCMYLEPGDNVRTAFGIALKNDIITICLAAGKYDKPFDPDKQDCSKTTLIKRQRQNAAGGQSLPGGLKVI